MDRVVWGEFILVTPIVNDPMGEPKVEDPFWIRASDIVFVREAETSTLLGRKDSTPISVAEGVEVMLERLEMQVSLANIT